MLRIAIAAASAACLLALAVPAAAQQLPSSGMTATDVANWLHGAGMTGVVKPDPTTDGDQIVSTSVNSTDTDIYFYDCHGVGDARRCTSIQYAAGFAPNGFTLDKINEWNHGHRYIKAYLTPGGSLYGEYDLDVAPGGTYEMLTDSLGNWQRNLADFRSFFGV